MTADEQKRKDDRRRLAIETLRARREGKFAIRNSAALIAGAISFLSVAVVFWGILQKDLQEQAERGRSREREKISMIQKNEEKTREEARVVSADLAHERQWGLQLANFFDTHKAVLLAGRSPAQEALRDVMQLSFPEELTFVLFRRLEAKAKTVEDKSVWENGQRSIDSQILAEPMAVEVRPVEPSGISTTQGLREQLNGPRRKDVSKLLAKRAENDKGQTVAELVSAILPEKEQTSYRVNLYVLVTLAMINGGWHGTKEQYASIHKLCDGENYKDRTYKEWADKAVCKRPSS